MQLVASIKERKNTQDLTGDPWNGRTLEWATASPPHIYNFAHVPHVSHRDAFWEMKQELSQKKMTYEDIHMPKNTPIPFFVGMLAFICGFCLIWHIFWLAILSGLGLLVSLITRLSQDDVEYVIPASEVALIESRGTRT
jgi:cytochrome o ubiquinol oxidase subunit 1